jgi:hypothetical protein
MIWDCCIPVRDRIKPDFMAAGGLAVELEAASLKLPNDLPVPEPRKATHSGGDHDRVVVPLAGRGQTGDTTALAPGLNQLPRDVSCDIERLGDSSPLRDQTGEFL